MYCYFNFAVVVVFGGEGWGTALFPCESVKTISGGKTIFTVKVNFYRGQFFLPVAVAVAAKS